MITADQLDKLCVITYHIVQGDTHGFTTEDWDFLNEVTVHAEDVMASTNYYADDVEDHQPDLDKWDDSPIDGEIYEDEFDDED
jgi:hypothetical protein